MKYLKKNTVEAFDQSVFHSMLQKRIMRSFKNKPDISVNASRVQYLPNLLQNNVRVLYEYKIPEDILSKELPLKHECTMSVQRTERGIVNYRHMCSKLLYDLHLVIKNVRRSIRKHFLEEIL